MTNAIKNKILHEFEEKRRIAEISAYKRKSEVYDKYPELADIDRQISNTATEYTKQMIGGKDVIEQMSSALKELKAKKVRLLKKFGYDEQYFLPEYSCKLCNDTGFYEGTMCSCYKKRVIEENFKSSNMGEDLNYQNFEKFDINYYSDEKVEKYPLTPKENMQKNLERCKFFADNFDDVNKSLLLIGGTGLGKTFLSTCIANRLLYNGKSVIYISAVDFFKRIEKARFDSDNNDVELFENCDLLIIDDLGTEAPSVYTTAVFSDILDKRVRCGRKMIVSSNNGFHDFNKLYGERVASRLAGGFDFLMFYGKDIRVQKFMKEGK